MKISFYIFVFLSISTFGQEAPKNVDQWTNKTPRKLSDSSLVFSDKKFTLYFDRKTIVQIIDVLTIQLNNKQTIADLMLVKSYLDKRPLVKLSSNEKNRLLKPYEKIDHNDSLALTYFYIDPLACETLVFDLCKIVVKSKVQTSYKIHTFGTTKSAKATYHLTDNTIFWKNSDAIMSRE